MKRAASFAALMILVLTVAACAVKKEGIIARGQSTDAEVFREAKDGGLPPAESADLTIRASLKTYPKDHFLIDPKRPADIVSAYPFVLNIDGHGTVWRVDGKTDIVPAYDEKGRRVPEGGEGIKYTIEKKVRVPAGSHTIYFGVPEERYAVEEVISLSGGTQNVLELKPVYKRSHRGATGWTRDFAHGLSEYDIYLNGKIIE